MGKITSQYIMATAMERKWLKIKRDPVLYAKYLEYRRQQSIKKRLMIN